MERLRRLAVLWSTLPAFRAVAETEHLPTASAALATSAPALSRMIALLEDRLGHPLFVRAGRRLELNEAGSLLLNAVREAMRRIDDAADAILSGHPAGPVRIAASDQLASAFLSTALQALHIEHAALVPEIAALRIEAAAERLRAGQLDVLVTHAPPRHPELEIVRLSDVHYSVYAGPAHPLAGLPQASAQDLAPQEFVAPGLDDEETFPPDVSRRIVLRTSSVAMTLALCAQGKTLAFLPHALVAQWPALNLRRVAPDMDISAPLYAVVLQPLGHPTKARVTLAALQRSLSRQA